MSDEFAALSLVPVTGALAVSPSLSSATHLILMRSSEQPEASFSTLAVSPATSVPSHQMSSESSGPSDNEWSFFSTPNVYAAGLDFGFMDFGVQTANRAWDLDDTSRIHGRALSDASRRAVSGALWPSPQVRAR
jgi:hypothetical protein